MICVTCLTHWWCYLVKHNHGEACSEEVQAVSPQNNKQIESQMLGTSPQSGQVARTVNVARWQAVNFFILCLIEFPDTPDANGILCLRLLYVSFGTLLSDAVLLHIVHHHL